ncbi:MAG: hypothetical protein ACIWVG_24305 [Gloeotrichia echinulata HAB0833]
MAKNSTVPFPLLACSQLWSGNVSFFALDSSRRQIKDYGGSLLSDLGKHFIQTQQATIARLAELGVI